MWALGCLTSTGALKYLLGIQRLRGTLGDIDTLNKVPF